MHTKQSANTMIQTGRSPTNLSATTKGKVTPKITMKQTNSFLICLGNMSVFKSNVPHAPAIIINMFNIFPMDGDMLS